MTQWQYPERIQPGLRNHFVYYTYNAAGEVIYIGCTRQPETRWKQHQYMNPALAAEATHCRMSGPYDFTTARRIEKREQYKHRPRHDARHPDRWNHLLAAVYESGGQP
jgi:hypothetical protein